MKTRRVPAKDEEHEEANYRRLSPRKRRKVENNTEEARHVDNSSELEEDKQSNGEDWQHRSDAENDHIDELNPDEKPEKTNKELVNVKNGDERLTITDISSTLLQKKPKLVLKKLPEEAEVQHVEKDMHTEDTRNDADKTSEALDNSQATGAAEATEPNARSPKDNQNKKAECEAETVHSLTHVQSPVEDVSPDVTDTDPTQHLPLERPPQSNSPCPVNDTPASTLLSSSELDTMAFEQLQRHEDDEHNSDWSVPKEAEQQHVEEDMHVEDTITDADKTSEAQDTSEETEDKEADSSSPKDNQNENAECAEETVPSPTHVQSPVEDVSPDVTDPDPAEQMPLESPPQSLSPSPIKDAQASTLPSSSELDKMDFEQQESNEEDEHNGSAGESDHKDKLTQNEQPPESKEEKVDVEIEEKQLIRVTPFTDFPPAQKSLGSLIRAFVSKTFKVAHRSSKTNIRTNAIITDIKRTMLKKKPKLVLKKLPQHILDSSRLKSTKTLVNGRTKREKVQNPEKGKNHDNAKCEVQNAAVPSLTRVQSPIEDPSPDLTNPEPVQQKLIERPPQSESPSSSKVGLVPTPLTNTELDTINLKQLKREKIKLQLKVLKLQEEYYTLQLKKLKE